MAEVLACEAVPKSKKLLKLTVCLGGEQRTVVAGIAEHYAPADLVGKKIVVVANLEPAKLMGIESNGMVLAGSIDGKLAVLTLDRDSARSEVDESSAPGSPKAWTVKSEVR